jgi:glycosyltransferase involved in cell wall biosynthesis
MRIAIVTAHSPLTRAGGHDGQLLPPAVLARALAGNGHRVTMYARAEDPVLPRTAILGSGVRVEHVKVGPVRSLAAEQAAKFMPDVAAYLAGRWRTRPPDVVHAFSWLAGLAAIGAVRDTDTPVVQSFESLGSLERRQTGADVPVSRVKLEAAIGRTVAAVLASSEEEAAELSRHAVPRSAIRVIPAGIDTAHFSPEDLRARCGDKPRLIALADDQARGLQTLIRALGQLPRAELTIVGGPDARHLPRSGPFRAAAQLAASLRVRSRVTFAGEVADADLPALLRSADIMVSATAHDPTGVAAIQAMACGLPAVASAVGGQRDAVLDGITGLLVAPDHPAMLVHRLRTLLAQPTMLQAYGIAAADRARSRYSIERTCQETAAAYEQCLRPAAAAEDEQAERDEANQAADLRGVVAFA